MGKCLFFHDAAEAYIGDMISPLKRHIPLFSKLENKWVNIIYDVFNVSKHYFSVVKRLDYDIAIAEMKIIMPNAIKCFETSCTYKFEFWSPEEAEKKFLDYFNELEKQ